MSERFVDPVIEEIHATRAAMLAAAGGDIAKWMRQVIHRQETSNRVVIRKPLRDKTGESHQPPADMGLNSAQQSPAPST